VEKAIWQTVLSIAAGAEARHAVKQLCVTINGPFDFPMLEKDYFSCGVYIFALFYPMLIESEQSRIGR
jgi:hypothetical protein